MGTPSQLKNFIGNNSIRTASPAVRLLIDEIQVRHGEATRGILFYGSCLRSGTCGTPRASIDMAVQTLLVTQITQVELQYL